DTGDYRGRYHVLGGLISPLDGIGPDRLNIHSLLDRVFDSNTNIKEVIFAFNPTNEGEVTINYLTKQLAGSGLKLSHLSYGIPVGSDINYTDKMTLSRSFQNRVALREEPSTP
ncbi:MAG: toprim domain-containing protein, partial [bacterium]